MPKTRGQYLKWLYDDNIQFLIGPDTDISLDKE
jgi:hypothetical protein